MNPQTRLQPVPAANVSVGDTGESRAEHPLVGSGKPLGRGRGDALLQRGATRMLQAGGDVPVGGTRGEGLRHGGTLLREACSGGERGLQVDLPIP